MSTKIRSASLIAAFAIAGTISATATATAQPLDKGRFNDVFTEDFDCSGTPTQIHGDARVNFNIIQRGPGEVFFRQSVHGSNVFTNLNTGGTFTVLFSSTNRDAKVVDNGDGTLTVVTQGTLSNRWYDTNGNFVLHDSGQVRFQFLLDEMGTPDDPFDDEEIDGSFQVIRDVTGRFDTADRDFCSDLVQFTS